MSQMIHEWSFVTPSGKEQWPGKVLTEDKGNTECEREERGYK